MTLGVEAHWNQDGSFIPSALGLPAYVEESALSLSVNRTSGVIIASFGGTSLEVPIASSYTPVYPFTWQGIVSSQYFNVTPAGPYAKSDSFSVDGSVVDDFNGAPGTLFSDPDSKWVDIGAAASEFDLSGGSLVAGGQSSISTILWNESTAGETNPVVASLDILPDNAFPATVTFEDRTKFWRIGISLINYDYNHGVEPLF